MSSTETWYVVRLESGAYQATALNGRRTSRLRFAIPCTWDEAKQEVDRIGGTVVKVTATAEDVKDMEDS